jgi:hypothetical protein
VLCTAPLHTLTYETGTAPTECPFPLHLQKTLTSLSLSLWVAKDLNECFTLAAALEFVSQCQVLTHLQLLHLPSTHLNPLPATLRSLTLGICDADVVLNLSAFPCLVTLRLVCGVNVPPKVFTNLLGLNRSIVAVELDLGYDSDSVDASWIPMLGQKCLALREIRFESRQIPKTPCPGTEQDWSDALLRFPQLRVSWVSPGPESICHLSLSHRQLSMLRFLTRLPAPIGAPRPRRGFVKPGD